MHSFAQRNGMKSGLPHSGRLRSAQNDRHSPLPAQHSREKGNRNDLERSTSWSLFLGLVALFLGLPQSVNFLFIEVTILAWR